VAESHILITGAAGLIGRAIGERLRRAGSRITGIDPRSDEPAARGDLRDAGRLAEALTDVDGVLHLGAVSRVVDGERNPELCESVNVSGTALVLDLARRSRRRPWVVYASSREVYGQQEILPVREDAPLQPKNVYARSKAAAERLVDAARADGLTTAIVRFSNVYGDVRDHPDRVVPAFARAAALAPTTPGIVRVDGADCTFDFTFIDDVADGLLRLINRLQKGDADLPPIHFVTGEQTSLGELAEHAIRHGGPNLRRIEAPRRDFDVSRFA
jgi:nucleoside-diphosphate-sugar epimerase